MSGPFEVGDVVVVVDRSTRPWMSGLFQLPLGATFRVAAIGGRCYGHWGFHATFIAAGVDHVHRDGWLQSRFRKVERATDEFTAQMRACKPIRVGEPA